MFLFVNLNKWLSEITDSFFFGPCVSLIVCFLFEVKLYSSKSPFDVHRYHDELLVSEEKVTNFYLNRNALN